MVQLILTILIYLIMVIPVGIYVYHIAAGKHTFADPVFDRVDGVIYKVSGIKPDKGMNWKTVCPGPVGNQRRHDSARIYHSENSKHCRCSIRTGLETWRNPFPSIRSSVL